MSIVWRLINALRRLYHRMQLLIQLGGKRRQARVTALSSNDELTAASVGIFTLPHIADLSGKVDAVMVVPGQGEWFRLRAVIAAWNKFLHIRHLLVAGHTKTEPEYVVLTLDHLTDLGLTRREGVVIEAHAWNTKEQADWLMKVIQEQGITSLALCAPSYHILRAYLTMLKAFHRHGIAPIPMIPMPVPVSPATISPLNQAELWDLMQKEFDRIREYQAKGDVATLAELREYLDDMWLTFEPLVAVAAQVMLGEQSAGRLTAR